MDFRNSRRFPAQPVKGAAPSPNAKLCCASTVREKSSTQYQVADILFDEVTKPSIDRNHLFNIRFQATGFEEIMRAVSLKPVQYPTSSDEEFETYFVVDVS